MIGAPTTRAVDRSNRIRSFGCTASSAAQSSSRDSLPRKWGLGGLDPTGARCLAGARRSISPTRISILAEGRLLDPDQILHAPADCGGHRETSSSVETSPSRPTPSTLR
jgi:hypothetical protein